MAIFNSYADSIDPFFTWPVEKKHGSTSGPRVSKTYGLTPFE
jgi:hypothetical protein